MTPIFPQLTELQENSPALIAVFDPEDRLAYSNSAYRQAYCVAVGETPLWADIMRRNHHLIRGAVIRTDDFEAWLASAIARRGKQTQRSFEVDLLDGRWFLMTETVQPDGWMLAIAVDITELRTDERELRQHRDFARRASQTDDLTGVANRRYMMSMLEDLLNGRHGGPARSGCVALFDIDFFKGVNDRFGHLAGDEVLIDFARTVQAGIRLRDGFGRIGGEEFMLVLPDTSPEQAQNIVDRILGSVRGRRPLNGDLGFGYTSSAGLAVVLPDDTLESLYARVDKALYAAKRGGRDRLMIAA
ncbi:sensor domain-containing diguanylate cyclase [Ciceribacter sp. L1K22]|uniref:GGDEF domain-containing protein n=1 Tax=Ciceribacter sp. L1K22 TaxID=2820275 RepID=UPI001ABE7239|nr:sensor domain-containing diguanylate cyclase [Ciceribacter sp. L1K22]MBO3759197.1 diguanylate cyclase [Ciceribacter sp. L1K22]